LAGALPHEVRFDDGTPLPALGETEVRIEESPATRLLVAHRGPEGSERETRFVFSGPKFSMLEDRSITCRFDAAPPLPPAKPKHSLLYTITSGVLAVLLFVAVLLRRRRG